MPPPTRPGHDACHYIQVTGNQGTPVDGGVITEARLCISINGREWVTILCSPLNPAELALGFLLNEALISSPGQVRAMHLTDDRNCIDVWLDHDVALPERMTVTSGCGGGLTSADFTRQRAPLTSTFAVSPQQIHAGMRALNGAAELYREVRGVHTSALWDGERLLHVAQDIGRHNTIDRLRGIAARTLLDTGDLILLASGRISSEMLVKAAAMRIPIVCSRTSPTSASVQLAQAWNITVIGYARGGQFRIYSAAGRILLA
jgi:FdhD protein